MEDATRRSRRSVLGRGLAFVAGAIGVGAVRRPEAARAAVPAATELRLFGRHFHLDAPSRRPGEVPTKGDRHTGYGELLDRPSGRPVGHFSAAHFTLESPFAPVAAASLELHTFSLREGTIHGLGLATRGAEGHFAVLGGTGRYAGARGSYVAHQCPRELGGDGTAEFNLTLAG
jgi:hypothetical protein